jgi:acetyltransferase-like isoleucine patch superfamily enzyme
MKNLYDLAARHLPSNALRIRCQRAKGVRIGANVFLGYDVIIETAYPELVVIEDHVRISHGVIILAHARPADGWMHCMSEVQAPVRIARHAALYAGAIVTPGVTVGEYAIVREGAVVTEDVPPFTMVAGSPARVIEQLPSEKVIGERLAGGLTPP